MWTSDAGATFQGSLANELRALVFTLIHCKCHECNVN